MNCKTLTHINTLHGILFGTIILFLTVASGASEEPMEAEGIAADEAVSESAVQQETAESAGETDAKIDDDDSKEEGDGTEVTDEKKEGETEEEKKEEEEPEIISEELRGQSACFSNRS